MIISKIYKKAKEELTCKAHKMKICDYCNKEIKGKVYFIELDKWEDPEDCEEVHKLYNHLHSECANKIIKLVKKFIKDRENETHTNNNNKS